jgi:hypothetical protein
MSALVLADIGLYTLSLWLHITSAVVGLGATFALSVAFPLALKLDARYMPFIHRMNMDVIRKLASPALLLIIITGIYQGVDADLMGEAWLGITFAITIVLGALQGAYFVPTDRKLAAMAEKELADGATTLSEDYQRQAQREGTMGAVTGLLIIIAVFFMVTKPF